MGKYHGKAPFDRDTVRSLPNGRTNGPVELNALAARAALQYDNDFITPRMLAGILRVIEFTVLALLGVGIFFAYVGKSSLLIESYLTISIVAALAGVFAINFAHGYELSFLKGPIKRYWRIAAAWGATLAMTTVALFLLYNNANYSRVWLTSWFVCGFVVLAIARIGLRWKIRQWARNGRMERRAVIVGGGTAAERLIRSLEAQSESDIRICGIFDDRDGIRSPPIVAGYPKLGNIGELVEFARLARIDMLIVSLPLTAEQRVLALLKQLWVLPIDIRLSAQSAQLKFRPRTYSFIGSVPLIDVFDRPLADWDWIAKRVFDIVVASLALIVLSPVFLATAIAVKRDSRGPVFFKQMRHGFNNQIVEIFKFRSLYHEMSDPKASQVVTRNDSRVTRVGRFIRRSSLDELPQLVNVLRGDLSLVGPRPHAVHALSSGNLAFVEIVDGYFGRHRVKPGITGWAQVKGWRGEIDDPAKLKRRFEHDLYYIENWSIWLDIYILMMTPISMVWSKSSY